MMLNIRNLTGINPETKKTQTLFILDSIIINAAYLLTTGIVISGYAIALGAGDFITALLNNCTNFATILSLLSFLVFEKRANRKKILLKLNLISRFLMVLIIFIPFVFHGKLDIILLVALVVISEIIWSIYRVGWIIWMMKIVPKETKTKYIYFRIFMTRLFMCAIFLVSGFVLDMFDKGYIGFIILFAFSYILSLLDVYILNKVDDTEYHTSKDTSLNLNMFLKPLANIKYRNYLLFTFIFYLALTMASSFTPIYLIKYLKLDYKFISAVNILSQAVMILSNLYWARIEKRKGFSFTIGASAFFTASEMLIIGFVTRSTWPLLFLSTTLAGIGAGGFGTSTFTYRYEIMPATEQTVYEGWYYFSFGLSMLIAPFTGKAILNIIPAFTNRIFANSSMQLLYLISFICLCLILAIVFSRPAANGRSQLLKG